MSMRKHNKTQELGTRTTTLETTVEETDKTTINYSGEVSVLKEDIG